MESLDQYAERKVEELSARALKRELFETNRSELMRVEHAGHEYVSFCCNDYLGLANDQRTIAAAQAAAKKFGVGAGSSRLVTGNHGLYTQLEESLADFKGTSGACIFGSGYLANLGIIPALLGKGDLILIDELAHNCLFAGSSLSGATVKKIKHNSIKAFEDALAAHRHNHEKCMVIVEGVYSMDGDRAPLKELASVSSKYDAWLLCDDAHGFGVSQTGRGSIEMANVAPTQIPLQVGTFSKAIGSYGGYLCASKPVIELVRTRVRTLIYSTGLTPSAIAAAIAALDIIRAEPDRVNRPLQLASAFAQNIRGQSWQSQIVPIICFDPKIALTASAQLREDGFLVSAIRAPTVPKGQDRLRISFTSAHTDADVDRFTDAVLKLKETVINPPKTLSA